MPKLIEIIGPPGSGKSSISLELENYNINNIQYFYHSNNYNFYKKQFNINIFKKTFITIKIIFFLFFFYLIFLKRFFLKKNYKKNFSLRMIFLFYKNLISIEILKKTLPKNIFLIMEPGPIMFFLQDYFYTNKNISKFETFVFNKFFLNSDYIINLKCETDILIKRLQLRKRGFPQRMLGFNLNLVKKTINKSITTINSYVYISGLHKIKIINIDSLDSPKVVKDKLINLLK